MVTSVLCCALLAEYHTLVNGPSRDQICISDPQAVEQQCSGVVVSRPLPRCRSVLGMGGAGHNMPPAGVWEPSSSCANSRVKPGLAFSKSDHDPRGVPLYIGIIWTVDYGYTSVMHPEVYWFPAVTVHRGHQA
jgi:hypothetical protein